MNKSKLIPFAVLIYVAAFVIASAGAINYAFNYGEHIYTVGGILNLIFGGYGVYRVWKKSWNEKYNPKK